MHIRTKTLWPVDIVVKGECPTNMNSCSVPIAARFANEKGCVMEIPGFYRGEGAWGIRFRADLEGTYSYEIITPEGMHVDEDVGTVSVEKNQRETIGQLCTKGNHFVLDGGDDVFIMGYECDFLFSMFASPGGEEKTKKLLAGLKRGGFNKIVLNAYAYDLEWNIGRTRDNDYGPPYVELWNYGEDGGRTYNPDFFDNLDRLIMLLFENGMYAELYFKVYNKMVPWPEKYSEEENQYIRALTARYQAFPNILWNFTKEGYFEKDKEYIFDRMMMIRKLDAYHHLCTIHDDTEYSLHDRYGKSIDYLTLQQQGEMAHACLYYGLRTGKPVVNGEFGNECGPNGILDTPAWKSYSAEDNARFAFQSVMAGAYITYYYAYTAWDVIEYEHVPKGFRYFRILRDFFEELKYNDYDPAPELSAWSGLCLKSRRVDADGNDRLLVYLEPKDERLYLLYWTGEAHLNPTAGKEIVSVRRKGLFSGEETDIALEDIISQEGDYKNGSMILTCAQAEPCVFVIDCRMREEEGDD